MLGSSRVIVQSTGTLCYDADFPPFGQERAYTSTCAQNYKFEGKERDTETQNDDFGARYYSWRVGRWLSSDWSAVPVPVPYANLTNPQTLNLYAMVADDPESFADLNGHLLSSLLGESAAEAEATYAAGVRATEAAAAAQQQTSPAQNQKKDDPQNLQLVPTTDSGSDHQPYRAIEYQVETKKGDAPNQNWYVTEQQTNTTLAPNGTSSDAKPNYFKDSVGGNGPADSTQTFWLSTTQGKKDFQTFVHTGAGDYKEIAIHIEHSGHQPSKPTEGAKTNGFFSWPGAKVVHYDWPGPHP